MVPLFPGGLPGGTELVVILLIAAMGIVPALGLVVLAYFFGKSRGKAEAETQPARESDHDGRR